MEPGMLIFLLAVVFVAGFLLGCEHADMKEIEWRKANQQEGQ